MMPSERTDAVIKSNLEPSWRLLLIVIASHMKPDQLLTWTKPETLAKETGLAKSTVMEILWSMEEAGVITRTDHEHKSKTIRIVWAVLAIYVPAKSKRGGNQRKRTEDRSQDTDNRYDGTDNRYQDTDNRSVGTEDRYASYRTSVSGVPIIGPEQEREQETEPVREQERILVPLEPARPIDPEPPCAPPQAIQASAPKQEAKEAMNTPLGLFGQGSASTADIPKAGKKAAAILQVWEAFRLYKPRCGKQPGAGDLKLITKFLGNYKPEEIVSVIRWAWQCDESSGDHLWLQGRSGREIKTFLEMDNLLVDARFDSRLRHAQEWEANPARRIRTVEQILGKDEGTKGPPSAAVSAPQEDPVALWDSLIKRRSQGIRIMPDDIPAHIQAAIRTAGGWNQLGLLNDFTEKQARTAFITAIRNPPINGATRTA